MIINNFLIIGEERCRSSLIYTIHALKIICMKHRHLNIFILSLGFIFLSVQKPLSQTIVSESDQQVNLSNSAIEIKVDLAQGQFSIKDKKM